VTSYIKNNPIAGTEDHEASAWMIRMDRGLSPAEQDELSHWLAENPKHGAAFRKSHSHWKRLDRLGVWLPEHSQQPNPDLLAPSLQQRVVRFLPATAALTAIAAALVFAVFRSDTLSLGQKSEVLAATQAATDDLRRVLEDGSVVELNTGALITVEYTAGERKVLLQRGEAHFTVAKNPSRPFIVNAGGVKVYAVGTAFNVRLDSAAVEVLVTEGRVQVKTPVADKEQPGSAVGGVSSEEPVNSFLDAKQRAVVSLTEPHAPPQIAALTSAEIERVIAWQHRLLKFSAAPLADIVDEFNRRNEVQIELSDSALASIRVTASFRSDNVEGFVQLMQSGFGLQAVRRGPNGIVLRKMP
jgi:transmembrane sensor